MSLLPTDNNVKFILKKLIDIDFDFGNDNVLSIKTKIINWINNQNPHKAQNPNTLNIPMNITAEHFMTKRF